MKDATMIPLQQLYLTTLVGMFAADKLSTVQQEFETSTSATQGRLWLVRDGTTVPDAQLLYSFGRDEVNLALETRSGHRAKWTVSYAGGLDSTLPEIHRALHAHRLAAPKSAPTKASASGRQDGAKSARAESQALAIEAAQR